MDDYRPSTRIAGRFEVASRPLVGGMGVVYLCHDLEDDRPVAIKTFRPEYLPNRAARQRFLHEGEHWVALGQHPHVVRCYEVVYQDPLVFLALELVAAEPGRENASLRAWLEPVQPLPLQTAVLFALQVARGITHACDCLPGFVHRDLKPENLLVGADRLPGWPVNRLRVTDFGLARALEGDGREAEEAPPPPEGTERHASESPGLFRTQLTYAGGAGGSRGVAGTPPYMAPEQWRGERLGTYTDVYALGCILYELLAGRRAFAAATVEALMEAHCTGPRPALPDGLPGGLRALLEACLQCDPLQRPQSWPEVEQALGQALEPLGLTIPPPAEIQVGSRAERVQAGWSHNAMGLSYLDIGQAQAALRRFEQAQRVGQAEGEPALAGAALTHLGLAYAALGDARRAIGYYEQRLEIAREIGDRRGEGNALGNLGSAYLQLGDARRAIGYYEQALEIDREIGDRRGEGADLGNLGLAYAALGDARRAIGYYEQTLEIHREIGDRVGEANGSYNLALLYHQQNQPELARPLAQTAAAFYTRIGHPEYARRTQALLAQIDGTEPPSSAGPSPHQLLEGFAPLIQAVLDAGHGNLEAHRAVEEAFDRLEQNGWRISAPIRRIWSGERDEAALTEGIDPNSALIIHAILERLSGVAVEQPPTTGPTPQQVLANFEGLIQAAVQAARGSLTAHRSVEENFDQLEQNGWHISGPIRRIWAGERDKAVLTQGLDESDTLIIHAILDRLK